MYLEIENLKMLNKIFLDTYFEIPKDYTFTAS